MTNAIANMHCPAPFEAMRPPGFPMGDGAQGENGEGNVFLQTLASLACMQWVAQGQTSPSSSPLGNFLDLPVVDGSDEPVAEDASTMTCPTPDTLGTLMSMLPILGTMNSDLPSVAPAPADFDPLNATSAVDSIGKSQPESIAGLSPETLGNPEILTLEATAEGPTVNAMGAATKKDYPVPAGLAVAPSNDATPTAATTATQPPTQTAGNPTIQTTASGSGVQPAPLQAPADQSQTEFGDSGITDTSGIRSATEREAKAADTLAGQVKRETISPGSVVASLLRQAEVDPKTVNNQATWSSGQESATAHQAQPSVFAAAASDEWAGNPDSFSSNQGKGTHHISNGFDPVDASKIGIFETMMKTASSLEGTPTTFAEPVSFDSKEVFTQVVKQAQLLTFPTHTEVHMQLQPPSLGQLHLLMKSENNTISIHIRAESSEISQFLQQALPQLQTALSDQGLQVDRLMVSLNHGLLSQDGGQGRRSTSPDQNRKTGRSGADPVSDVDSVETSASLSPAYYSGRAAYTINYLA